MQVPEFIEELVKKGIEVTIGFSDKYGIYFDMNTGAKSHCHLVYNDKNILTAYMRYGEDETIRDLYDLYWCVKGCMYGRDYINSAWAKILVEEEILKKKTETKVSYY